MVADLSLRLWSFRIRTSLKILKKVIKFELHNLLKYLQVHEISENAQKVIKESHEM